MADVRITARALSKRLLVNAAWALALFALPVSAADTQGTSLLDQWSKAIKSVADGSFEAEETYSQETPWPKFPKKLVQVTRENCVRSADGRFALDARIWEHAVRDGSTTREGEDAIKRIVWDGQTLYNYFSRPHSSAGPFSFVRTDAPSASDQKQFVLFSCTHNMDGFFSGAVSVPEILRASVTKVVESHAALRNASCYVLTTKNEWGDWKIWIDSDHGFHCARGIISAGPGDLLPNGKKYPLASFIKGLPAQVSSQLTIDVTQFEKVDGIWWPTEATYKIVASFEDNSTATMTGVIKRSKIVAHPDLSKAFQLDVPNGTRVVTSDHDIIDHVWKDGKVVPKVDEAATKEIDRTIDQLRSRGQP
jgi:hypothetical protein